MADKKKAEPKELTSILDGADTALVEAAAEQTPSAAEKAPSPGKRARRTQPSEPPQPAADKKEPEYDPLSSGMVEEEAVEAEEKPEEKPEVKKSPHSPRAIQLAKHYGLTPEWIESATPEELAQEIRFAQAEEEAQERLEAKRLQAEKKKRDEEEAKRKAEEDELDLGEVDDEDENGKPIKRKATIKDISPAIAKVLVDQNKKLKEQDKVLKQVLAAEEARHWERIDSAIDSGFEKLGEEFVEVFGTGPASAMTTEADEFQARKTIVQAAGIQATDTPAQITRKVQEAAKRVYGKFVKPKEQKKEPKKADPLEARKKAYANGVAAHPTATSKSKPSHLSRFLDDIDDKSVEDDLQEFFED